MPHKKTVYMKPICNTQNPNCPQQFNIKGEVDKRKKVKSKEVFEGYYSDSKGKKNCGCKKCKTKK